MKLAAAVPAIIAKGIERARKEVAAREIARPMREMFSMMLAGESYEYDGEAIMKMPDGTSSEWCAIAPAMHGWCDCWLRIAPRISTQNLRYFADRLEQDKPITPRLIEKARNEFEATISHIPTLSDGEIRSGLIDTQIKWEFERMGVAA